MKNPRRNATPPHAPVSPKQAGIVAWLLLTGAAVAPAAAQDAEAEATPERTSEASEAGEAGEVVVDGSGEGAIQERQRRREQTAKTRPRERQRESARK